MREIALERANNRCEWADCINYDQRLEMAHLIDIGMGGSKTRKYDLYDGRSLSLAKKEYRALLKGYLDLKR
jgi:hypothetical protein